MTLLEMIKKYEGIKGELEKSQYKVPPKMESLCGISDGIEITNHILKDLRSILKDTSEITIHNTILEKLSLALEKGHFDDALKLSQMLSMI